MSQEPEQILMPPGEDTTASPDDSPTAQKPAEWVMPEPVFQQSPGFDPTADRTDGPVAEGADAEQVENGGGEDAAAVNADAKRASVPFIASQPELPQDEPPDEANTAGAATAPKRSAALRIVLIILALIAMAVALAVFLAVVYFLFFYTGNESQNLN